MRIALRLVTEQKGGVVPRVGLEQAPKIFAAVHAAITKGLVRACHDPSEGGLAVALAEMAFAGGVGADVTDMKAAAAGLSDTSRLFSESPTRFVLEVRPANAMALREVFADLPLVKIGTTVKEPPLPHRRRKW